MGLGSVLRRQGQISDRPSNTVGEEGEEQVHGILTAMDEYQFWSEVGTSSNRLQAKERAHFFQELLQPLAAEFANLDSLSFSDGLELVDETQNTLDDLWKQADHHPPYPEKRMIHLFEVLSGSLGRFVQRKLSKLNFWKGQYSSVYNSLQDGLMVCEQWSGVAERLTTQFWKHYTPHPWKGACFVSPSMTALVKRLEEVSQCFRHFELVITFCFSLFLFRFSHCVRCTSIFFVSSLLTNKQSSVLLRHSLLSLVSIHCIPTHTLSRSGKQLWLSTRELWPCQNRG